MLGVETLSKAEIDLALAQRDLKLAYVEFAELADDQAWRWQKTCVLTFAFGALLGFQLGVWVQ